MEHCAKKSLFAVFPVSIFGIDLQSKYPYSVRFSKIGTRKSPNTDTFHTVITEVDDTSRSRKTLSSIRKL